MATATKTKGKKGTAVGAAQYRQSPFTATREKEEKKEAILTGWGVVVVVIGRTAGGERVWGV